MEDGLGASIGVENINKNGDGQGYGDAEGSGTGGGRIWVWGDGGEGKMINLRKSYQALEVSSKS